MSAIICGQTGLFAPPPDSVMSPAPTPLASSLCEMRQMREGDALEQRAQHVGAIVPAGEPEPAGARAGIAAPRRRDRGGRAARRVSAARPPRARRQAQSGPFSARPVMRQKIVRQPFEIGRRRRRILHRHEASRRQRRRHEDAAGRRLDHRLVDAPCAEDQRCLPGPVTPGAHRARQHVEEAGDNRRAGCESGARSRRFGHASDDLDRPVQLRQQPPRLRQPIGSSNASS